MSALVTYGLYKLAKKRSVKKDTAIGGAAGLGLGGLVGGKGLYDAARDARDEIHHAFRRGSRPTSIDWSGEISRVVRDYKGSKAEIEKGLENAIKSGDSKKIKDFKSVLKHYAKGGSENKQMANRMKTYVKWRRIDDNLSKDIAKKYKDFKALPKSKRVAKYLKRALKRGQKYSLPLKLGVGAALGAGTGLAGSRIYNILNRNKK